MLVGWSIKQGGWRDVCVSCKNVSCIKVEGVVMAKRECLVMLYRFLVVGLIYI